MLSSLTKLMIGIVAVSSLAACQLEEPGTSDRSLELRPHDPQLNLSHIECRGDGTVHAHFVLLHTVGQPGDLSGTWSGGSFGPIAPGKNTGNVWHYDVYLPSGYVDIETAEVDGIPLHNPGEYAGDYLCGGEDACRIDVKEGVQCIDVLGNPGNECGYFGLNPIGKDDGLSGLEFDATMDAYVAIVKSGRGECDRGEGSYNIYVGVETGDTLDTPFRQDISHVTYCECPPE